MEHGISNVGEAAPKQLEKINGLKIASQLCNKSKPVESTAGTEMQCYITYDVWVHPHYSAGIKTKCIFKDGRFWPFFTIWAIF